MECSNVYKTIVVFMSLLIFMLVGCSNYFERGKIQKVGMLVENTIHDQAWGQKGYLGLLSIEKELGVEVYFKEGVDSEIEVNKALHEFSNRGVNLVFGHGNIYGKYFTDLSESYPNIHFIYFNGSPFDKQLTSLNFQANAMGFFGGMVAASMTKSNHIGVIAAYEWQSEVEGFFEGAKYENPDVVVEVRYVNSWNNKERALTLYNEMNTKGVDVYYPAGDSFNIPLIQKIKEDNHFAIGYISDQLYLGSQTVLTSTVQHVDRVYLLAAKMFNEGKLPSGQLFFDFKDDAVSLGEFSSVVPNELKEKVNEAVKKYIQTGKLPNE